MNIVPFVFRSLMMFMLAAICVGADAANMALRTGPSKYFLSLADPSALSPNRTFTVEMWIKARSAGVILSEVDAWDVNQWDYSLAEITPAGDVVIGLPGIAGSATVGRISFGAWTHLALRYDVATSRLEGFINGELTGTALTGTRRLPSEAARQTYWGFGRSTRVTFGNGGWLDADFDEIKIWNTARSNAQIAANQNTIFAGPQGGLVVYFHLDEGQATTLNDASGFGRNGHNQNATWIPFDTPFAGSAATFTGNGYVRSARITRPFFETAAFTHELWVKAEGPGGIISEVHQFNEAEWDHSFLEIRHDGRITAAAPGIAPIVANVIEYGRWYHVALRYSPGTQDLDLFLDGAKVGTSSGTRLTPWDSGKTVFMCFGRAPNPAVRQFQGKDITFNYNGGPGSLLFAPTGNTYLLLQPGLAEERGIYSTVFHAGSVTFPGRSGWVINLFQENGDPHSMEIAFAPNSTVNGDYILREPESGPMPVWSGTFTMQGPAAVGAFRGQMDEIRMWREALSDTTISANHRIRINNADSRLFAMWSLDSLQGTVDGYPASADRSANNNPAALVNNVTLTPSGAPLIADARPTATTGEAVASGAVMTLNGTAGTTTPGMAYFRFGRGGELTGTTASLTLPAGQVTTVQASVQGLELGATYSYVLVASNEAGTVEGAVRTFVAPDLRPIAATGTALDAAGNSAVLRGSVTTSVPGTAHFIWGETEMNRITDPVALAGGSTVAIEAVLNNLEGGKTYRFALVASNEFGTRTGETRTFTKIGWAGSSLLLTGSSYLRTQNDQRPFFTDETFTMELWIKPQKAGVVIAEVDRTTPSALDSSLVEILSSGTIVAGLPGVPLITIGAVTLNEWSHIAVRYDKTAQRLEGWVNGVKSANSSIGDRVAGWELGRQIVYTFGKSARDRIGTGEHLDGEYDEIRLWSNARTDAEIAANVNRKLFGTEGGMVAYYQFDERNASVTDHSRHNNTGTIVGAGSSFVASGADVSVDYQPVVLQNDGGLKLQFTGVPGREIRLRHTSDFVTWTDGPTAIVDQLGIATFIVTRPSDAPVRFYIGQSL